MFNAIPEKCLRISKGFTLLSGRINHFLHKQVISIDWRWVKTANCIWLVQAETANYQAPKNVPSSTLDQQLFVNFLGDDNGTMNIMKVLSRTFLRKTLYDAPRKRWKQLDRQTAICQASASGSRPASWQSPLIRPATLFFKATKLPQNYRLCVTCLVPLPGPLVFAVQNMGCAKGCAPNMKCAVLAEDFEKKINLAALALSPFFFLI